MTTALIFIAMRLSSEIEIEFNHRLMVVRVGQGASPDSEVLILRHIKLYFRNMQRCSYMRVSPIGTAYTGDDTYTFVVECNLRQYESAYPDREACVRLIIAALPRSICTLLEIHNYVFISLSIFMD